MASQHGSDDGIYKQSEIINNITHEIRTPLNAITGLIEILSLTELTPKQREYLNAIRTAVRSLLFLSNSVIDYSRINAGVLSIENSRFKIVDVLESVFRKMLPEVGEKEIEFSVRSIANVPKVLLGDAHRLEQVLTSLAQNAVKFTENGFVAIDVGMASSTTDNTVLTFSIKDTGIGISPEQVPQLFEPFIQGDASSTRKYGGVGVGLALSQKLVQIMGGEIKYRRMPLNGSEFYFSLPFKLSDAAQIENQAQPAKQHQPQLQQSESELKFFTEHIKRAAILLIEDDPISQDIEVDILKGVGLEQIEVRDSGALGIEAVKAGRYDLVLMDIEMVPMNGYETTMAIRNWEQQHGIQHIPIIALTAHNSLHDIKKCLEARMDDYITKPIEPLRLLETIRAYLPTISSDANQYRSNTAHVFLLKKPGMPTGINMKEAISRFGGNREAFYRHLLDFARKYDTIIRQIHSAWNIGDDKFVIEQLHVIQGVAGNLSATRIADKALELKNALVNGQSEAKHKLINEFEGALREVIDSVLIWDYAFTSNGFRTSKDQNPLRKASDQEILPLLTELEKMLIDNNLSAEELIPSLFPLLDSAELGDEFRQLETRITLLDFKGALHRLTQIRKYLTSG